jgi:hypothetical protein
MISHEFASHILAMTWLISKACYMCTGGRLKGWIILILTL